MTKPKKIKIELRQFICMECLSTVYSSDKKTKICTGAAWLSSARVVRCWVKSRNERNPYC